jgi:Domain of Unknown Function (DUF1080)
MASKRLIPIGVVALLLLVAAAIVAGASQTPGVRVPPGAIVDSPNANANPGLPNPPVPDAPALAPAQGDVLFYDSFSNGLDRWESLSSAPGTWQAREGRLQQLGDANGDVTTSDQQAAFVVKDLKMDNAVLEAQVYAVSGSPVGVLLRGSEAGFYRLSLYPSVPNQSPKAVLEKVTPDQAVKLATAPPSAWPGYSLGKWLAVKVAAAGSHITVTLDGTQVMEATDGSFGAGWAGIWTLADRGAQFDNVRIQRAAGR